MGKVVVLLLLTLVFTISVDFTSATVPDHAGGFQSTNEERYPTIPKLGEEKSEGAICSCPYDGQ